MKVDLNRDEGVQFMFAVLLGNASEAEKESIDQDYDSMAALDPGLRPLDICRRLVRRYRRVVRR